MTSAPYCSASSRQKCAVLPFLVYRGSNLVSFAPVPPPTPNILGKTTNVKSTAVKARATCCDVDKTILSWTHTHTVRHTRATPKDVSEEAGAGRTRHTMKQWEIWGLKSGCCAQNSCALIRSNNRTRTSGTGAFKIKASTEKHVKIKINCFFSISSLLAELFVILGNSYIK